MRHIAMLSVHSCPLAALGGKETGGMNVYVRELSREMGRLGLKVDVFTRSQNPHISPIVPFGRNARVIHFPAGPEEPIPKNEILSFLPEFTARILQFSQENKIHYDFIHSHYWLSGWVGGRLQHQWSVPFIHMFHTLGILKNSVTQTKDEKESRDRLRVEKQIMGMADCLIAPNPWEREQMIQRHRVQPLKIQVIPCGVDLTLFKAMTALKARRILGLSERKFILFVGRIDSIKGIDVLIKAVHHLSRKPSKGHQDLGLIIIGGELDEDRQAENREMQKLRKMVSRMKLQEKVAFWGSQRQDLLPYFYSAAKALVLPSRYESFGMVALEAMACGTPVVASRVGGLQYTIEDGKTGFLFPEGNWKVLADRIREVIENPPVGEKLRQAALRKVRQFSWPNITQKVLSLYDSLRKS
jgi:D-inositol-3-phosphate glycosyltransferase